MPARSALLTRLALLAVAAALFAPAAAPAAVVIVDRSTGGAADLSTQPANPSPANLPQASHVEDLLTDGQGTAQGPHTYSSGLVKLEDVPKELYSSANFAIHSEVRTDPTGNPVGIAASVSAPTVAARVATRPQGPPSGSNAAGPGPGLSGDNARAEAIVNSGHTVKFTVPDGERYAYTFNGSLAALQFSDGTGSSVYAALLAVPPEPDTPLNPIEVAATDVGTPSSKFARSGELDGGTYQFQLSSTSRALSIRGGGPPWENATAYAGSAALSLNPIGAPSATVTATADAPYAGISVAPDNSPTAAALLGGTASADTQVSLAVSSGTADSAAAGILGGVVNLSGTGTDQVVLSVDYDDSGLTLAQEQALFLAWLNPDGGWVNAVDGNTGGTPQKFIESYDSYLATLNGGTPALGAFGVDTVGNSVWAVINHNSAFGAGGAPAISTVPEPLAAFGGAGLVGLLAQRRRRGGMA